MTTVTTAISSVRHFAIGTIESPSVMFLVFGFMMCGCGKLEVKEEGGDK